MQSFIFQVLHGFIRAASRPYPQVLTNLIVLLMFQGWLDCLVLEGWLTLVCQLKTI